MGMFYFYTRRCHSKWVHFQMLDTHIQTFLYWIRAPQELNVRPTLQSSFQTAVW